jgi:hypothetical protein
VGKVKGGITGCRNVRRLQLSKQDALCKMAYNPVIQDVGYVNTFFQQDVAHPHTAHVTLDILCDVTGSCVLLNQFP